MRRHVVLMAKEPRAGRVKTRLIPALGSRDVVMTSGVLLLASGLILLRPLAGRRRTAVAALVVLIGAGLFGVIVTSPALASPCDRESSYFCIRTIDEGEHPSLGRTRSLVLDHLLRAKQLRLHCPQSFAPRRCQRRTPW